MRGLKPLIPAVSVNRALFLRVTEASRWFIPPRGFLFIMRRILSFLIGGILGVLIFIGFSILFLDLCPPPGWPTLIKDSYPLSIYATPAVALYRR